MSFMIKFPFQVKDAAANPHYLEVFGRVARLFREESKSSGLDPDVLIVEDFGTTLIQTDWMDKCGWYVTYRLHPMYSHMQALTAAAARAEGRFAALFPGAPFRRDAEDAANPNGDVTLLVEEGCHSIGD